MHQDSRHIIQACLKKDRSAQHRLYKMYNHTLMTSATFHLNDCQKAQEVVQETWVDVFKGLEKYDESKSQLITWMKTILIRKIWKTNAIKNMTTDLSELSLTPSKEAAVLDNMSCEEILNEMDKIPRVSRMVFKMYVVEGYKHSEIATILDIKESTSRVHLTKARTIMRDRYNLINKVIEK